ncbi:Glutamate--tRNA ligase mitochondrial [Emydomyces testavorans]|uniref:Glutamate--tRNA ligase mitochondrial n=1 Tax=Emydomyces testavorans TaxID=2070801 RepID=A0AAF0DMQ1_9EURO|nr:Glutamate--tRNA ligase mitochondrial [Emydomyces testavorans]
MRPSLYPFAARTSWICKSCRANLSTTAVHGAKKRKSILPDSPARTRFAPSPTGYLHLGSLRTALFNYLLAKRTGGQFLLRIEDTDQSERTALYQSQAQSLIANGHAYRCFCSPERLDTLARHRNELGLPPGYDGTCVGISKEESDERAAKGHLHVVRLRVAKPYPMFEDIVYGKTGQNREANRGGTADSANIFADPILLKSDGHPTYHLANVVDDHFMKITHVIRGTEWMSSTPMHVALYDAFQWQPPIFGHVPLLVEKSGQKLSKRNADIDIACFRDEKKIMPATLINFAALLGWSHSQKSDVFDLKELEEIFDLKLTKGNTIVSFEKMWFLQKAHAERYAATGGPQFDDIVRQVSDLASVTPFPNLYYCPTNKPASSPILKSRTLREYISSILREGARSYTNPTEFLANNKSFFTQSLNRPPYTRATTRTTPLRLIPISALHTATAALSMVPTSHWNVETHRSNIAACTYTDRNLPHRPDLSSSSSEQSENATQQQLFRKELYHFLRWALSGGAPGLGIPSTMEILGREESVRRLGEAMEATKALALAEESLQGEEGIDPADGDERRNAWMGSLAGAGR